jgi:hypothetical protein
MFAWPLVVASLRSASNGCGHRDVPRQGPLSCDTKAWKFNGSEDALQRISFASQEPEAEFCSDGTLGSK